MRDRCDVVPVTLRRDLIPAGAFVGAWRSLVARLLWEQEAPGSNPGAPTTSLLKKGAPVPRITSGQFPTPVANRANGGQRVIEDDGRRTDTTRFRQIGELFPSNPRDPVSIPVQHGRMID